MIKLDYAPHADGVVVRHGKNTMVLPNLTVAQFEIRMGWWRDKGMLIQDAFPMLNADQREFLMTGLTPEEWGLIFEEEEGV